MAEASVMKRPAGCLLGALVVGLGLVLEVASVLNGDGLADLRDSAGALLVSSLGNAHDCLCK